MILITFNLDHSNNISKNKLTKLEYHLKTTSNNNLRRNYLFFKTSEASPTLKAR